jgi:hypothetical protein
VSNKPASDSKQAESPAKAKDDKRKIPDPKATATPRLEHKDFKTDDSNMVKK